MDPQKIEETLNSYIHRQTFPVAVKMVRSPEEIPERARMPKRDMNIQMPVCQGIALARRYGWVVAMGLEDMLCPLGALTLGFLPTKEKFLDGSFDVPFWVKNQSIRAKISQKIPQLDYGKYTHLVVAPIHRAEFDPQVIVIYGNPAQISRLVQAATYETGDPLVSQNIGGLACGEEITRTILTDRCQFIVVGGGDRAIAQTQDHEVAFAIPMSKVDAVMEGLKATHKAGLKYPTPSFLLFKGSLPPDFAELMDYLKEEGD
ncbi:MAG: hypothetical protein EF807_07875 [Candidatus Methanolliviera hydrocarbonicum]|uniref:DUF169 domain-containing protein n=1 Tax=Candidatus Methanolliviera hydrocarbonicum TaxID=2491085 RepID=A0A520KUU7_9EURY|nr:MAG: hypothetical protein EF807_07875 [Candidatus Methanolliviera hydrocarbonicum]